MAEAARNGLRGDDQAQLPGERPGGRFLHEHRGRGLKELRGDIPGITANNARRTITIRLVQPRGDFLSILALLFAAPVPAGNVTWRTSPRADPPSTGLYHIVDYTPNQDFTLVRNRYFKPTRRTRPVPTAFTFG